MKTTVFSIVKVLGLTLLALSITLLFLAGLQVMSTFLTSVSWNELASVSWNG